MAEEKGYWYYDRKKYCELMKELNDIDNLFKDAIESADFAPSDKVWNSIEGKLQQREVKGNQKTIRNLRVSVAVVSTLLTSTLAYQYFSPKPEVKLAEQNAKINVNPGKVVSQNNAVNVSEQIQNVNASQPATNKTAAVNQSQTTSSTNPVVLSSTNPVTEETVANTKPVNSEPKKLQSQTAPVTIIEKDSKDNGVTNNILMFPYFVPDFAQKKNTAGESTASEASKKNESENLTPVPVTEKKENIIFVPNAFTPNGDGLNDTFLPKASEEPTEYKMWIFDTRGTMVFFSDDFTKGWDGRSIVNGAETIKEDMYMWRMEIKNSKGEKEHLTGYLTLLKN
ncbi:MAG: T9SS type B sorting domain-containing protein [Bacteroidia bacterium]